MSVVADGMLRFGDTSIEIAATLDAAVERGTTSPGARGEKESEDEMNASILEQSTARARGRRGQRAGEAIGSARVAARGRERSRSPPPVVLHVCSRNHCGAARAQFRWRRRRVSARPQLWR